MQIYDHVEQMSPEWFLLKSGIPSGSSAGKIITPAKGSLSAQADGYINELLEEMAGLNDEEEHKWLSRDMEIGIEREPDARRLFELETGMPVRQVAWVTNDLNTAGCSPDGLIELPGKMSGWETKCPKARTHIGYLRNAMPHLIKHDGGFDLYSAEALPIAYKCQCHWSMAVTGLQQWYFQSYHPDLPPLYVLVTADDFTTKVRQAMNTFTTNLAEAAELLSIDMPKPPILKRAA